MRTALNFTRRQIHFAALLSAGLAASPFAQAQGEAARAVKIVVPFGPGGAPDLIARLLANALGARTGRAYVVENRAGANGVIGTDAVAKAAPDGSVLLLHGPSLAINPSMYKKLPFDTEQDLVPISNICATEGMLFVVNAKNPARSLKEFVDNARKGSPLAYPSPGTGNAFHLASERFLAATGIAATHVPYKGAGEAVTSLLSQDTQFIIASAPSVSALVKSGQLRPLAILSSKRSADYPGVQTMGEAGFENLDISLWYGLLGPKGLSATLAQQIAALVRRELNEPATQALLAQQSLVPVGSSPQEFTRQLHAEIGLFKALTKRIGIVPE